MIARKEACFVMPDADAGDCRDEIVVDGPDGIRFVSAEDAYVAALHNGHGCHGEEPIGGGQGRSAREVASAAMRASLLLKVGVLVLAATALAVLLGW